MAGLPTFFRFENYLSLNKAAFNYVIVPIEIVPIMKSELRTYVSVIIKLSATLRSFGQGPYNLSVSAASSCKIPVETLNALER